MSKIDKMTDEEYQDFCEELLRLAIQPNSEPEQYTRSMMRQYLEDMVYSGYTSLPATS